MDFERDKAVVGREKLKRQIGVLSIVAATAVVGVLMVMRSDALPSVDRSSLLITEVQQGNMVRTVSGTGTFVATTNRLIPAGTQATVEALLVQPGARVEPGTVLITLSNFSLSQAYDEARLRMELVAAEYAAMLENHEDSLLDERSRLVSVEAERDAAKLQMETEESLLESQSVSLLTYKKSKLEYEQLLEQVTIQSDRLERLPRKNEAERRAKQAELDLVKRQFELQQELVDSMQVRAGISGIVQEISVEAGEAVTEGQILALVAGDSEIHVELRVVESQAVDVEIGQSAEISYSGQRVDGTVTRIDPSVRNGTVTIDVTLDEGYPDGARPNLRASGSIEVERMNDVLFMSRPVQNTRGETIKLYVVSDDIATLRDVRLGKESLATVEIVSGLEAGERVVLSDVSEQVRERDRFALN